jgi:hypothetical protein
MHNPSISEYPCLRDKLSPFCLRVRSLFNGPMDIINPRRAYQNHQNNSIEDALSVARTLRATDSRDKTFALLGIYEELKFLLGPADYSQNIGGKAARLLAHACSASVQASSPSAQVKVAAGQIGDRNWNWKKKFLCSTIGVDSNKTVASNYHVLGLTRKYLRVILLGGSRFR